ncbi:MAG: NADH-quinone oxidoreductase subunit L [Microthrixaceae bacterium]|nr:NADH-quinone oxidoreductase subunit L [Microthrixaceae bacterium]
MWFFTHVWIVPAMMALSFLLILFFGKKMPKKGAEIGIFFVALCLIYSLFTLGNWITWSHDSPTLAEGAPEAQQLAAEKGALANVPAECSKVAAHPVASVASEKAEGGSGGSDTSGGHGDEGATAANSTGTGTGEVASGAAATSGSAKAAEAGAEETLTRPVVRCATWIDSPEASITWGTQIDGLSIMMLLVVPLISLLVHIFSTDYVHGDRRYTHYFAFLSLFTASMLFFVLSQSTLQMIVGWELVGVCSFALIGHWWEEKPNSDAALKAFLTNRVGDMGLLIGMIILFFAAGNSFSIMDITILANEGGIRHTVLMAASICLIAAVMSKSGQFILHTWLPDAMAGPTPVSALIHAATMVVAGIFMVARLYPVFFHGLSISGSSINLLAVVGAVTALFGALLAFVQKDIKKVLAYSTVSQLGFMVTSLGVGAWTAAMFHLFTHAFFKACLFLGAGSLSHACHHSFNMVDDMGGLRKIMPKTFWTYLIATGALAGIFPLSGFWSKDEILAGTGSFPGSSHANGTYHLMLIMLLIAAFCTAAYMTRTIWYAFYGEYRGHGHPHESGPRITVPLIILATLGAIAGLANLPAQLSGWLDVPDSVQTRFEHLVEPVGLYFPQITHAEFNPALAILSVAVGGAGIVLVYLYYWKGAFAGLHGLAGRNRTAAFFKNILVNKYYFDWLYTDVITGWVKGGLARGSNWVNKNVIDGVVNGVGRGAAAGGRWVYDNVDQTVVDGAVNGAGSVSSATGGGLRRITSGHIQQYAALFFAAAAVLAGMFVVLIG